MSDSPASATPYEILGVASTASHDELRRAYRRRLRETHPDTGGSPALFHAVQNAWERVGEPGSRASYDRGLGPVAQSGSRPARAHTADGAPFAARPPSASTASSLKARSYGHPGGRARERFLELIREWVGRGTSLEDPYDPALVRSAPREIRWLLAKALSEEATARVLSELGMGFTVWNGVAAESHGSTIDHVVLGPSGLFAVSSQDWGGVVRLRRGEVVGESVPDGSQTVKELVRTSRKLAKGLGIRFTGYLVVVPDGAVTGEEDAVGHGRNAGSLLIARSRLPAVLRGDRSGVAGPSTADVFEVRTRLQQGIEFA